MREGTILMGEREEEERDFSLFSFSSSGHFPFSRSPLMHVDNVCRNLLHSRGKEEEVQMKEEKHSKKMNFLDSQQIRNFYSTIVAKNYGWGKLLNLSSGLESMLFGVEICWVENVKWGNGLPKIEEIKFDKRRFYSILSARRGNKLKQWAHANHENKRQTKRSEWNLIRFEALERYAFASIEWLTFSHSEIVI